MLVPCRPAGVKAPSQTSPASETTAKPPGRVCLVASFLMGRGFKSVVVG